MSFFAMSTPIQYRLYGTGTGSGDGVLEVQIRYSERIISVSSVVGRPPRILHETPPTPFHNGLFYFSLRQLQNPLFYITHFLYTLNIRPAACEIMARRIASYIVDMSNGNRETNFHIIAEVNFIRQIWMDGGVVEEETVVLDEAPPARRGVALERVRKLRSEEKRDEELGDCCICLDEMSCDEKEVIRIGCGHVFHEACLFKWLQNHNSCPLCRNPLPLEEEPR